jgi:hypothetical protein
MEFVREAVHCKRVSFSANAMQSGGLAMRGTVAVKTFPIVQRTWETPLYHQVPPALLVHMRIHGTGTNPSALAHLSSRSPFIHLQPEYSLVRLSFQGYSDSILLDRIKVRTVLRHVVSLYRPTL